MSFNIDFPACGRYVILRFITFLLCSLVQTAEKTFVNLRKRYNKEK